MQALGTVGVEVIDFPLFILKLLVEQREVVLKLVRALYLVEIGSRGELFLQVLPFLFVLLIESGNFVADIGKDEHVGVFLGDTGGVFAAAVGHLDRVLFLIEGEAERFVDKRHTLAAVLQVKELGLPHELSHARLLHNLLQTLVAWKAPLGTQKCQTGLLLGIVRSLLIAGFQRLVALLQRSEERRVGKERRARRSTDQWTQSAMHR